MPDPTPVHRGRRSPFTKAQQEWLEIKHIETGVIHTATDMRVEWIPQADTAGILDAPTDQLALSTLMDQIRQFVTTIAKRDLHP